MTTTSSYLGLTLYNSTTDQSASLVTWTQAMSSSANSNMIKIDNWSGSVSGSITTINSLLSGSLTSLSASMNSVSASLTTIGANISTLQFSLASLYDFNGSGLLDFDDIPQTYKHLLIIGVVAVNDLSNVDPYFGCDFNGDANAANYSTIHWQRELRSAIGLEWFSNALPGGIYLGTCPNGTWTGYGSPFIALVPNYTANGGFYKTAMGLDTWWLNTSNYSSDSSGGTWFNTQPITRLRMFGVDGTSRRIYFLSGTRITIYGFG